MLDPDFAALVPFWGLSRDILDLGWSSAAAMLSCSAFRLATIAISSGQTPFVSVCVILGPFFDSSGDTLEEDSCAALAARLAFFLSIRLNSSGEMLLASDC